MEFVGMEGILGAFLCRIGTEPTHSTRFSVDESSGVRRECAFHSLLSYRSGNVDQPACYLRTRRCPEGGRRNDCNALTASGLPAGSRKRYTGCPFSNET